MNLEDELKVCCGPTDDVLEHMRKTLSLMKQRSDATSSKDGTYERLAAELDKHLGLGTSRRSIQGGRSPGPPPWSRPRSAVRRDDSSAVNVVLLRPQSDRPVVHTSSSRPESGLYAVRLLDDEPVHSSLNLGANSTNRDRSPHADGRTPLARTLYFTGIRSSCINGLDHRSRPVVTAHLQLATPSSPRTES